MPATLLNARRFRFTMKQCLIMIAVAALLAGGIRLWPRVEERIQAVAGQSDRIAEWKQTLNSLDLPDTVVWLEPNTSDEDADYFDPRCSHLYIVRSSVHVGQQPTREEAEFMAEHRERIIALCQDRIEYHKQRRQTLARSAWTPWWPVERGPFPPPIRYARTNADPY